ncbi:MAG: NUDIX hydrolase [Trueperella sp.]|nr:NUDIX hydrolase [Trueperella sp.]
MPELRDIPAPEHVEILERKVPFVGPIFSIEDDLIRFSSGEEVRRQRMNHDDAVAVAALRPGESGWELLVIQQYRHPVQQIMWEIPAGLRDIPGEPALQTAQRELAEEAGLSAKQWYRVANFISSPGCANEDLTLYLAFEIAAVETDFVKTAEEAEISLHWVPLAEVLAAIFRSELRSPTLVLGAMAAHLALTQPELFPAIRLPK